MKKQTYFILMAVILIFCFKGQTAYAEETPLQVEDNWLTREVARQVNKSDIKTLTQEDFEKITKISIDDYKKEIAEIPKGIAFLTNLTELTLSNQRIKELPKELFSLINLKTLDFSLNFNITKIPKEINQLKNLESLDLSYNNLYTFPKEILTNIKLKNLDLAYCTIDSIPEDIKNLTQLKELVLCGNKLKQFPKEISQLYNLIHLNLGTTEIQAIPSESGNNIYLTIHNDINKLTKLEYLDLSYNFSYTSKKPNLSGLKNLKKLNMRNCGLKELPKGIETLPQLTYLNLQYNYISKLPYFSNSLITIDGTNQNITLPWKKVILNSILKVKNIVSASNGAILVNPNNNGTYNEKDDSISWNIDKDSYPELSYTFKITNEQYPHIFFQGKVFQYIEIIDDSKPTENKIYFTDDYESKTVTKEETIRIPIKLSTIKDYYALDSSIKYDKSKLQFLGYSIKENYKDCYADSSDVDTIRFILASKGKNYPIKTSDDPIIYLNFKCIAAGDANVTITFTTLANLDEEVTINTANLDKTTIHITESSKPSSPDINRDGKFSLIDLAIDAYYYGVDADETDKTKYDADIIPDGKIDDLDLMEITKNIINN